MGIEGLDKQRNSKNKRVCIAIQHTGLLEPGSI
jgi:hypothetical protein